MCQIRAFIALAFVMLMTCLLSVQRIEAQSGPMSLHDLIGRTVTAEVQFASEIRRDGRLLPRSEKLSTILQVKSDAQVEIKTKRTSI